MSRLGNGEGCLHFSANFAFGKIETNKTNRTNMWVKVLAPGLQSQPLWFGNLRRKFEAGGI